MNPIIPMRRLPLEGAQNTRDLGGYPCGGGSTRWGVFLRSDSPHHLSEHDIALLREYGVRSALDLRSEYEREARPSLLTADIGFSSHHVAMSDRMTSNNYEGDVPGSMSGLYISLLDNAKEDIVKVFRIFASSLGGTLFHCAVGKDRTGVISMLLLGLAGVSDNDIVADYSITETYMREIFSDKMEFGYQVPEYILRSMPQSMWRVLQHLYEHYTNAETYLLKAGLAENELAAIRRKLIAT